MIQPRVLVLLNKKSGTLANSETGDEADRIARGFTARGVPVDVRQAKPDKAKDQIAEAIAQGVTAVVVGGGDGTINAVANAVAGTDLLFSVLPLGTHNHFAKEMGVPDDLDAAVATLAEAVATGESVDELDVAELNGVLFLNFSGVGLHPQVVEAREAHHEQIKRFSIVRKILRKFTKPLSTAIAFLASLGQLRFLRLLLVANGKKEIRITPAVVIGNNVHQIEVFGVADISVMRRDVLNAYVARVNRPIGVFRVLLAAATRQLSAMREFEVIATDDLTIHNRRPRLKVSVDGEVMQFATPLRYRVRRKALRMICPQRPATESTAAENTTGN